MWVSPIWLSALHIIPGIEDTRVKNIDVAAD